MTRFQTILFGAFLRIRRVRDFHPFKKATTFDHHLIWDHLCGKHLKNATSGIVQIFSEQNLKTNYYYEL